MVTAPGRRSVLGGTKIQIPFGARRYPPRDGRITVRAITPSPVSELFCEWLPFTVAGASGRAGSDPESRFAAAADDVVMFCAGDDAEPAATTRTTKNVRSKYPILQLDGRPPAFQSQRGHTPVRGA